MYTPPGFKIEDPEVIRRIVDDNGFATLVTPSGDGVKVTHLPLLFEPSGDGGVINGHMAKANDHWQMFDGTAESVAIFHGPDAYVSPEWYETPGAVPTWNYAIVHMRGPITHIDDTDWLLAHVDELVDFHENKALGNAGTGAPEEIKLKLINAIIGFQMQVTTIEAKFKLNQNRSKADRVKAANSLDQTGDHGSMEIAAMMREFGSG
ncbi:MAG: FMN-binding negative transcriptional regulator [Chloroflexi bacterium]|nr:FMN-binding negative transcriptional regulator [Chloroflexota bacterium]